MSSPFFIVSAFNGGRSGEEDCADWLLEGASLSPNAAQTVIFPQTSCLINSLYRHLFREALVIHRLGEWTCASGLRSSTPELELG